jgi:hypothetical protein
VIPFEKYQDLARKVRNVAIDDETLQAINRLPHGSRVGDHACIFFSVKMNPDDYTRSAAATETGFLEWLLRLGDQIVDLLRLFLYRPGDDRVIGRAGSLGRGVFGLWLISQADQSARFIARRLSRYALLSEPVRLDLETFKRWYSTDTFTEFRTAVCMHPGEQLPLYDKVMAAMRSFRESREMQSREGRFRQLTPLIEDLAKDEGEVLTGHRLYDRIAQVAWYSLRDDWDGDLPLKEGRWRTWQQLAKDVSDLWKRIRNPLAHSCRVIQGMPDDPERDLITSEALAVSMIRGLARACFESGATDRKVYEILAHIDPDELYEVEARPERGNSSLPEPNSSADSLRAHQDGLARKVYGQTHPEARARGVCVKCRSDRVTPGDFRDDLSRKEFTISGLCQRCQDAFFEAPTPDEPEPDEED